MINRSEYLNDYGLQVDPLFDIIDEKDKLIQELKTALLEIVKRFPNEINSSYLYKELFDGSEMIKYKAIAEK